MEQDFSDNTSPDNSPPPSISGRPSVGARLEAIRPTRGRSSGRGCSSRTHAPTLETRAILDQLNSINMKLDELLVRVARIERAFPFIQAGGPSQPFQTASAIFSDASQ